MSITGYISVEEFQQSSYYCAYTECCGSTGTTQIAELIDVATSLIDNYLGRTLWNKSYEDKFIGKNLNSYYTAFIPVTEISSITYKRKRNDSYEYFQNGFSVSTSGSIQVTNYELINDRTGLIEVDNGFSKEARYTILYRAGYTEIPEDVKTACKILVVQLATMIDSGNIVNTETSYENIKIDKTSFSIGASKYVKNIVFKSVDEIPALPYMVQAILKRYKYSKRLT